MPGPPSSSTNRYRGQTYYQQPYWRNNPQNSMVEYAPGYHVPADRWMQRQDGSWIDIIPQTPDQGIFSTNLPQLDAKMRCMFMGTPSRWVCRMAELRPDSRPMFVFRHLRFTAEHKLNVFSAKNNCMFRHEGNLCLFVNHFWGRVCTMHA